jgi:hypothetical protein
MIKRLIFTLFKESKLDRPGQGHVVAVAWDLGSEGPTRHECDCQVLVGHIWRQIGNVQKRFVKVWVRLWDILVGLRVLSIVVGHLDYRDAVELVG